MLPVGGIKEKVIAAHRAGIRTIVLPARNEKDLDELPPSVLSGMSFVRKGRATQTRYRLHRTPHATALAQRFGAG